MGICSALKLPTPDQARVLRPVKQKHEMPTKMDRAEDKKKATALDVRKLTAWAKEVKARDGWRDRFTGKRVKGTRLVLHPDAAHSHHVEPRENVETRYDTRNGICLSAKTHDLVERNQIRIVGTVFFTVNGKRYINADHKVRFEDLAGKLLRLG